MVGFTTNESKLGRGLGRTKWRAEERSCGTTYKKGRVAKTGRFQNPVYCADDLVECVGKLDI